MISGVTNLRLLGNPHVQVREEWLAFPPDKRYQLLAYLAQAGDWVDRDRLADLFWPNRDNRAARRNLNQLLRRVRAVDWVRNMESDPHRLRWTAATDVTAFRKACDQSDWERALELYSGRFLEGLEKDARGEYADWLANHRAQLEALRRRALLKVAEEQREAGCPERATELLHDLLEEDELDEEVLRAFMEAAFLSVGPARALDAYRRFAAKFEQELGLGPSQATQELALRIARGDEAPTTFQTTAAPEPFLPSIPTSFVGRLIELAEIAHLLAQEECRLVTLVGPGGVGKSRLALQAAQNLTPNYPGGVTFVALEALSQPEQVPIAVAGALKLDLSGIDDPIPHLIQRLERGSQLLVLDNFEQLLDAAPLVTTLLRACPQLTILTTSRERLDLQEEWLLPVHGLAFPESDELEPAEAEGYDALRLLLSRARQVRFDFHPTHQELSQLLTICRLVEGSPLALELAAGWLRVLSCRQVVEELQADVDFLNTSARDAAERHRSIRAVFEHSWRLLAPREREVLRQLAVFQGGFTWAAAAEIVRATIAELVTLVDKSLLRSFEDGRFDRHPLLYQYIRERLDPEEAEIVHRRHATFFLKFAEEGTRRLEGPDQLTWLERFETEYENLEVALEWVFGDPDDIVGPRLVAALCEFWRIRGRSSEAKRWLELGLAGGSATATRARLLMHLGMILVGTGSLERADTLLEEATRLSRRMEDEGLVVAALHASALAFRERNEYDRAEHLYLEALNIAQIAGDRPKMMRSLGGLADIANHRDDFRRAWALYEQWLELARELGDPQQISAGLEGWSVAALKMGKCARARAMAQEGLALARQVQDVRHIAFHTANLGLIARADGDVGKAKKLLQESLIEIWCYGERVWIPPWFDELAAVACDQEDWPRAACLFGAANGLHDSLGAGTNWLGRYQQELDHTRAALGAKRFAQHWLRGKAMSFEEAYAFALEARD